MIRITRLLVPTDFSPTSEIALQYALDIAPADATIRVLHVIDDARLTAAYPDGVYVEIPGQRDHLIEEARRQLQDIVRTAARPNLTTDLLVGWPVGAIVQDATLLEADLIVMGTHGRSGLAHALLGSVTERVLRTAPCPVLTVRDSSRVGDVLAGEAAARRQGAQA